MKKYLSIIALATLAIVGCSKVSTDVLGGDGEETPISFQAVKYLSQTKADTHDHLAFPDGAKFDVWAYFHDTEITGATTAPALFQYFVDEVSKNSEGNWAPKGGPYYWPKTGMLSFFALYPTDANGVEYGENGFSIKEYTVPALYTAQAGIDNDLMFAQTLDQNCDADTEKHFADGVGLIFQHELAKVMFEGKLLTTKNYDSAAKKVNVGDVYFSAVIDEISISGIKNIGTFALDNTAAKYLWTPKAGQDLVASGVLVNMDYAPVLTDAFAYDKALPADEFLTFRKGNDSTKDIIEYYVLPQELADDAKITVKYTVYAMDKDGKVISKTSYPDANHTAFTKKLNEFKTTVATTGDTALDKWEINKIYNYRFIIDPFEGQIYFDPCMADWDKVDADPVTIHPDVDN